MDDLPTLAQRERLEMLAEEAAEVIKCVTKILRHGWDSYNPDNPGAGPNRQMLEKEIGDFQAVTWRMLSVQDIYPKWNGPAVTWKHKLKYTHYQED